MKIAMVLRSDYLVNGGGDVVQAASLAKELTKLGHQCDVTSRYQDLEKYEIVHLFNSARIFSAYQALVHLRSKQWGGRIIYSPIWHPIESVKQFYYQSHLIEAIGIERYFGLKEAYYERLHGGFRLFSCVANWKQRLRDCVERVDLLMPNSFLELNDLLRYLAIEPKVPYAEKAHVVKNATEVSASLLAPLKENLVVCPGRIEPRKNQLLLINAFLADQRLSNYSLIIAGSSSKKHKQFLSSVQNTTNMRIDIVGHLNRKELDVIFGRAKVCILASYFETTGLVGLEAMAKGCSVAMTTHSYNDEYYGTEVSYCDPYSETSITNAICEAIAKNEASNGNSEIRWIEDNQFDWESAAKQTLLGYELALGRPSLATQSR